MSGVDSAEPPRSVGAGFAGAGAGIDWCTVPAGPFAMGRDAHDALPPDEDERPRRLVSLAAFRISRVPVTNRRFHGAGNERPVTYVTRAEAEAFCEREGVRLPTEEEWEAAARGTDDGLWPWGDELPDRSRATFAAGIGSPAEVGLHPAGASPVGALDMAGNVWEWVADRYAANYYRRSPARNPRGPTSGTQVGLRGGSWLYAAPSSRTTERAGVPSDRRNDNIGLRCVQTP